MISFGTKATDKATGFSGVVTGRAHYMTGCTQYLVEGESKDGAKPAEMWIGEGRLVKGGLLRASTARSGGPQASAPSRR